MSSPSSSALVWKARPVFISSTFKDMHAERDYLRNHAFLELAERLRDRCHFLDAIDLRQGVDTSNETDETAREKKVLKVCLDEIERSKPFLVAVLGDRYGWIPDPERSAEAAERIAGVRGGERAGALEWLSRSVTELEILYGVLENPDQCRRSWFYFRTLDRTGMPPEVAARFPYEEPSDDPNSPAAKLRALKDRIRRELPGRVRDYTLRWDVGRGALAGLAEFDAMVKRDLWSDVEAETAAFLRQAPKSWPEADARALADFVAERTRGYVARPAVTDPVIAHALSPDSPNAAWGLAMTGESGGGKSALFGTVYTELLRRAEKGDIILLAHAAGISPQSGQVDRMLRRWIDELSRRLGIRNPIEDAVTAARGGAPEGRSEGRSSLKSPASSRRLDAPGVASEQIEEHFAEMLGRTSVTKRVILLVDALNQFEPTVRADYLTWLPKMWPSNARLIATAVPCTASATLVERSGCAELRVPPLSRPEAAAIAERYYRERHHRPAPPRVLSVLLDKRTASKAGSVPAHGNPLWLALALQEMNLMESDDFDRAAREFPGLSGAEQMERLQLLEAAGLPSDIPGVYGELLSRTEREFGLEWTRAFIDVIALGRSGWRESDLRALVPALSGRPWDPLVFAGVRRILGTHIVQRGAYAQWDFFHAALRQTVLQRDFAGDSDRRRFHGLIADWLEGRIPDENGNPLSSGDPVGIIETMTHLIGLGDKDRAAAHIERHQRDQWTDADSQEAIRAGVETLAEAIHASGDQDRDRLTEWVASLLDADDERSGHVAKALVYKLSDALEIIGAKTTEVPRVRILLAAQARLERLAAANPGHADWPRSLSVCQERLGGALWTQGDLGGALQSFRAALTLRERLAALDPKNADGLRDLSVCQDHIGHVLQAQGDLDRASIAYRASLAVAERLAASDPSHSVWQRDLTVSHDNIGDVLWEKGDLGGALQSYRASLAIRESLAALDPRDAGRQRDLSVSRIKIGDVLGAQGDLGGALISYRASLAVRERLAASDPRDAGRQRDLSAIHIKIGDALVDQGDLSAALPSYRASLAAAERLAAANPANAEWQRDLSADYERIGDILEAQGDLPGALKCFREALAVRERLAASDPTHADGQSDLSISHIKMGDVLRAQGDLGGMLKSYQASLAAAERLASLDPKHAVRQRDLSVSQDRFGDALRMAGDLDGALRAYRASLSIREGLASSDPSHTGWQRDLSVSHIKIGDVLRMRGEPGAALQSYRAFLAAAERLASLDPRHAGWQRDLSVGHERMGDVLLALEDPNGALQSFRASLEIRERLAASEPSNAVWQRDLALSHMRIGEVLGRQGDPGGELKSYRASLAVVERLAASDSSHAVWQRDLLVCFWKIAECCEKSGRDNSSLWWQKAGEVMEKMKRLGILMPADEPLLTALREKLNK